MRQVKRFLWWIVRTGVRTTLRWREVDSKLRSPRRQVLRRNPNSFREIDKARRLGTVVILARNRKFESTPLQRGDGMGQAARKCHHRRCKVTDGVPYAPAERLEQVPRRLGPR